jgi:hypothetical protein
MAKGDMSFVFDRNQLVKLDFMMGDFELIDKRQAIMNALRRGSRNMVAGGKRNLASRNKKHKGHLSKSFKTKSSKKLVSVYAGFSRSGENKGNHAHLVDRGTRKRWTKKGKYTGSVSRNSPQKGTKFWTDVVKEQGKKTMNNLMNTINQELIKIINRRK